MMESEMREKTNCIPLPATTGPRPHRCEVCQRSFREVATLRKHEQLHRADRPYICNTCGKSFLWSSNLKVHERVHTGERPYKCKICHRCFTQSNDLRRHERNVHMRGKLYTYKNQSGRQLPPPAVAAAAAASAPAHMNLAAYQAFALQQRAILQHALTYESLMQNAASSVTSAQFMQQMGNAHTSVPRPKDGEVTITTSTSLNTNGHESHDHRDVNNLPQKTEDDVKLEQVTPPPSSYDRQENMSTSQMNESPYALQQSPRRSAFSPTSSKTHSPPPSSNYGGIPNGHHSSAAESPELQKDDRPQSRESHLDYRKYFSYPDYMSKINDLPLPRTYASAFNMAANAAMDSVMDLSMNKSVSSIESEEGDLEWKARHSSTMSSKSPVSESESESKRDVTTTSAETPTADSGIHHCPHCNIFFHDFTMFNLHQSLHPPVEEDPFLCPSCLRHCQDRIEFMFHIVWHVKYPHTIPKYQTFKETYLATDP